jgi:GDPmannose 4,6-dehydratase
MTALILGADSATGAYLARLLEARGQEIFAVPGDSPAITTLMGPEPRLTRVPRHDALPLLKTLDTGTLYALNDGCSEQAALVEEALAVAPAGVRLAHVVDNRVLRRSPTLLAIAKQVATLRRDSGRAAATIILHDHDSRLGPANLVTARVIAAAWAAGQDTPAPLVEIEETGPRDWGWTAEYVDAVGRIAALDKPVDFVVGSGHTLTVAEIVEHAFAFFRRSPEGHVRILPGTAAAEAPIDTQRLKDATGWSASTWGRDLVRALCEGAAARQ